MNNSIRPRNLPADERRNVTVEAVVELAASTNPAEITTAAIAKHMNLTQGALFRHFPNKEAIWQAVMKWVAERLMARIDKAAEGIGSPLEAMQAMFLAHVAFVSEHPGAPRMLFGELQGAKATPAKRLAHALLKQYAARLNDLIETGKTCGELPHELDNEAAATLFIGTIQGLGHAVPDRGRHGADARRRAAGLCHLSARHRNGTRGQRREVRGVMHIRFLGAAREVTGSCYLIETKSIRFLVDCGMVQGGREAPARNRQPFDFDPGSNRLRASDPCAYRSQRVAPQADARRFQGPDLRNCSHGRSAWRDVARQRPHSGSGR